MAIEIELELELELELGHGHRPAVCSVPEAYVGISPFLPYTDLCMHGDVCELKNDTKSYSVSVIVLKLAFVQVTALVLELVLASVLVDTTPLRCQL